MSILERSTLRPKCIQLVSGGARIHIQDFLSTKLIDLTMPRSEQGKMEVEMKEEVSSAVSVLGRVRVGEEGKIRRGFKQDMNLCGHFLCGKRLLRRKCVVHGSLAYFLM